jgi:hypothetical protein
MPDINLIQSVTYLMDCFLDDYTAANAEIPNDLDLRAQIEVNYKYFIYIYIYIYTYIK